MPLFAQPSSRSTRFNTNCNLSKEDLAWFKKLMDALLSLRRMEDSVESESSEDALELVNPFNNANFGEKFEHIANVLEMSSEEIAQKKQIFQETETAQTWALSNLSNPSYHLRNLALAIYFSNTSFAYSQKNLENYEKINNYYLKQHIENSTYAFNPILALYLSINYALLILNDSSENLLQRQNLIRLVFLSIDKDRAELRSTKLWTGAYFFTNDYSAPVNKQKLLAFRGILEDNIQLAKQKLVDTFQALNLIPPQELATSQKNKLQL